MATTAPTQGAAQKLEENPALPTDTPPSLAQTLSRIFRVIAQVVNPIVAWVANWANVSVTNASTYTNFTVNAPAPTGSAYINANKKGSTTECGLVGSKDGLNRWFVNVGNQSAESGSNAGSDFGIYRYNDAGAAIAPSVFWIARNTGAASFTGSNIALAPPSGDATIGITTLGATNTFVNLNKGSGGAVGNYIQGLTNSVIRWQVGIGHNASETGSNVGSDYVINRFSDAGAYIDQPFGINRANGNVYINVGAQVNFLNVTGLSGNDSINARGNITSGGGANAFYSASGGCNLNGIANANGGFTTGGWQGVIVNGSNGDGSTYRYIELGSGNPNWNLIHLRPWHSFGAWAGFQMYADSANNAIQFILSNAGGWGSIRALGFEVQSDERIKERVAPLPQQHDAFMGIKPILWQWPMPPEPKEGEAPIYPDTRDKWGFSAQNLAVHVPLAVNGSVIAEDADGKPLSASVDPIPISALTVLEVQALWQRIATLETRIAALETV